jgi:PAS domain S-box-containing protein
MTMNADRVRRVEDGRELVGASAYRLRFQELFQLLPDGLLVTDDKGIILEANQAAAAVLRCPNEFLVGMPFGLFVAATYRHRFYDCLARLRSVAISDEFETQVGSRNEMRMVAVWVSRVDAGAGDVPENRFRWVVQDVTERRRVEAARDDLRRLVRVQEDERRRIARELHDTVSQLLTALLLGIRAVRDAGPLSPLALTRLDDLQRVAHELGRSARNLAVRLRPTVLDDLGLEPALGQLVGEWSAQTGLAIDFQTAGLESARLPAEVETVLYRVVQEALTNVAKHARAQQVSVVVSRHNGYVTAVVEDDGVGFDPKSAGSDRLGLIGMYERVALVGGELDIESTPGAGTTTIARVPVVDSNGRNGRG